MIDLRTLPLLAAATEAEAARILENSEIVATAPGETLFPPFESTDAFWILIEGRWRVTRRVAGTPQLMFEADRPGTWTGGARVIDAIAPPMAEVLAPSRFLKMPIATLEDIAGDNPRTAQRLLEALHWGAGHIGGLIAAAATPSHEG
ncbi:MAG: hypothetical protein AAF968_18845 [Pseudomonadota bacterium]